jgi:putative transposase
MVSPQAKRQAVEVLQAWHGFGVTRACGLIDISRSLYRYRSRRPDCAELRQRMGEIAAVKRRYGYRRIHVLLRREGWEVNRKKTYRLYRELGLAEAQAHRAV